MKEYATIFKKLLTCQEFSYSASDMARWSGLTNAHISRFLNDKCEISATKFFQLLGSMPQNFQQSYWDEFFKNEVAGQERNWRSLVKNASDKDIEEILKAVAERYAEVRKKSLVAA